MLQGEDKLCGEWFPDRGENKQWAKLKYQPTLLILQFDYFLTNIVNVKNFALDWLELGEKIGHLVVEGGDEFWYFYSENLNQNKGWISRVLKVLCYAVILYLDS